MKDEQPSDGPLSGDDRGPDRARRRRRWSRRGGDLPEGEYDAEILAGYRGRTCQGSPYYKAVFWVTDGPYAGARFFLDIYWGTEPERQAASRELPKLGITRPEQLDGPPPHKGRRCRARVTVQERIGDRPYNHVDWFEVVPDDTPEPGSSDQIDAG